MSVSDLQVRNTNGNFVSVFPITIGQGGTEATNAAQARANLGISPGNLGLSDYVSWQGTSGIWRCITFASGWAMCFAVQEQYFPQSGVYVSGWYYKDGSAISYPYTFSLNPSYYVGKISHQNSGFITTASNGSNTTTPRPRLITASSGAVSEIICHFAIGRL